MMLQSRIFTFISSIFFSSLLLTMPCQAQSEKKMIPLQKDSVAFFRGVAAMVDIVGPLQLALGDYGQYEAGVRINLKDKFFPVAEIGYGKADAEDAATRVSYKTSAPYGRIGMDFNLLKNKHSANRVYGGLRYAYTNYKFDIFCPGVTDPTWGESAEFKANGVECYYHWLEFVFGLDTKIWGPVRLGWSARYKRRLFHEEGGMGRSWYVPGFGKQGNARLGGTFNVIVEF